MRATGALFLVAAMLVLLAVACAKATPTPRPTATPPPPTPTTAPGVTPVATKVPTAAPTATLLPTIPAVQFPLGEPAPGVYKTYEEAQKDWPNVIAAAKKEGKLQVSSFGAAPAQGTWTYDATELFSKRYGITLEFLAGPTAQQLARLEAEKASGRYTMDIFPTGTSAIRPPCARGFCEPFVTPSALEPGVPWLISPLAEGAHIGPNALGGQLYLWQPTFVLINTKLEPDRAKWPKSFKDLEDPYWKGKWAADDPRFLGNFSGYWELTRRAEAAGLGLGLDDKHTKAFIGNLARFYGPGLAAAAALVKGEYALNPMMPSSSMIEYTKLPKPWNWELLEMKEGVMGWILSTGLFKNAPHPNAGKLFADFYTGKEADEIRGKYWGSGVLRRDTPVVWPGVHPAKVFPGRDFDAMYGDPRPTAAFANWVLGPLNEWITAAGF